MSNPLFYLAGLLLALAYPTGVEPLAFARTPVAPWAALGIIVLHGALSWGLFGRVFRGVRSGRAPFVSLGLRLFALLLYLLLIYIFHFPLWIWSLGLEESLLAGALATLAPLVALYGVQALAAALRDPRGGRLGFSFRSFVGLSFLPILSLLLLETAFERIEILRRAAFLHPAVGWGAALVGVVFLMAVLPFVIRFVFAARPLPAGALRVRLEQVCRSAGFRCSNLLTVETRLKGPANAFIVGLMPVGRGVFFTDTLLSGMTPEQVECVLAHEIVHSKKHHILFYLVFALGFSLLSALAHEGMAALRLPAVAVAGLALAWALFFWIVVFGFVSRRFESEADLVAARLAPAVVPGPYGAAPAMAAALETVAALNGVPLSAPSWRHFSIARRMMILVKAAENPASGESFERACSALRRTGLTFLLLTGLLCLWMALAQRERAGENGRLYAALERMERGRQLARQGRPEEALVEFRAGLAGGADDGLFWLWTADAARAAGREHEAREAEENARRKGVADPRARLRLE